MKVILGPPHSLVGWGESSASVLSGIEGGHNSRFHNLAIPKLKGASGWRSMESHVTMLLRYKIVC